MCLVKFSRKSLPMAVDVGAVRLFVPEAKLLRGIEAEDFAFAALGNDAALSESLHDCR